MAEYRTPADFDQWVDELAGALHARNRWRLSCLLVGIVFATGRRTVTSWLRAAGISDGFADYYYFLQPVGRRIHVLAERLLELLLRRLVTGDRIVLAIDDTPTKRYGPQVQGAGIHHNPTPGPAHQQYLYGHIWVTISLLLQHPLWHTIGLPLIGLLYVREVDVPRIPPKFGWVFRTKLALAVQYALPLVRIAQQAGKSVWIVADGAYAKRPFLKPLIAAGVVVVSRLRKDAALYTLPDEPRSRGPGRPRKYGRRIHLQRRAAHRRGWQMIECTVYGQTVWKTIKTFLASYPPAGGVIRVVIVLEDDGPQYFFSTDPSATPEEIIAVFADRASIEQDFHDVKEVWGAGQQQVRVIWTSIACFNLNLWLHSLVECWAWHKPAAEICDRRACPWDDPDRRPSHADRRKALRHSILQQHFSTLQPAHRLSSKIHSLFQMLLRMAA